MKPWTDAEQKIAEQLRQRDGLSVPQIAAALGRSHPCVRQKLSGVPTKRDLERRQGEIEKKKRTAESDMATRRMNLQPAPAARADGHVLVAFRTLRSGGWIYPPGCAVPAESWPNLRALLEQHALAWMPASRVSPTSKAREIDAPPPDDDGRKVISPEMLDAMVAKHDRGNDPVASWRALVADLSKKIGNPALARDRLALHRAAQHLEQRAQRSWAESASKRPNQQNRRTIDGLYSEA